MILKAKIYNLKTQSGQSLIEAMVAMSIIFFGILGVYGLAARAVSLNRVVADRYIAIYLASEGIELVKNMVDANILERRPWNDGLFSGAYEVEYRDQDLRLSQGRKFLFDENNGTYNYISGKDTNFQRTIKIEVLGNGNELKVTSLVNWLSRGGDYSVDLEDHFFNWR